MMHQLYTLMFAFSLLGLCIVLLSDNLQTIAKHQGALKKQVASGYNLAMKVMVLNRIGAVVFYLLISINIDKGISPNLLIAGFGAAILVACVPTALILFRLQHSLSKKKPELKLLDISDWPKKIFVATFLATIFNLMGLTIPLIAGTIYPEFRLTLANTSFAFNTVYTVISVFYIENEFAKSIDSENTAINSLIVTIVSARLVAFLLVGLVLSFVP